MTDLTDHPDPETLAACAAGDLEPGAAETVSRHLTGCADCAADAAAIARVTDALALLPPLAMPVDVITSLERALEAERNAATGPAAETVALPAGVTVPPSLADARRRRRPTLAPYAAAAAVIGLAAAVGLGALRDNGMRDRDASSALDAGGDSLAEPATLQLQSGTDYAAGTLADQVRTALSAPASTELKAAAPGGAVPAPGSVADPGSPAAEDARAARAAPLGPQDLDSCLQELSGGPGAQPVLVDSATYAGMPALVIVLAFRTDKLDVFVVRPDCRVGNDALIYFQRIDA